jgi:hypothetical protein
LSKPLFDTPRFVRNLERAYKEMWNIFLSGQKPRAIRVAEIQPLRPMTQKPALKPDPNFQKAIQIHQSGQLQKAKLLYDKILRKRFT